MPEDYGDRLDQHEAQLAELRLLGERLLAAQLEQAAALARLERRLESIEARLENIEGRLEQMESRMDRMEGRLENIE